MFREARTHFHRPAGPATLRAKREAPLRAKAEPLRAPDRLRADAGTAGASWKDSSSSRDGCPGPQIPLPQSPPPLRSLRGAHVGNVSRASPTRSSQAPPAATARSLSPGVVPSHSRIARDTSSVIAHFWFDHLALDLALNVAKKSVFGTATLVLRRVDPAAEEVHLDAVGFDLRSVRLDGARVAHRYDGRHDPRRRAAREGRGHTITVAYGATPRRGALLPRAPMSTSRIARDEQVWSSVPVEEDMRVTSFLCIDKPHVKMTTELSVRVPNGWDRPCRMGPWSQKETPKKGAWRFHWKMDAPHPSYLLTLVAGEFDEIEESAMRGGNSAKRGASRDTVPAFLPRSQGKAFEDGIRTFARTPNMIEHFAALTGTPYPWNKYAQVVVSDLHFWRDGKYDRHRRCTNTSSSIRARRST